MPIPDERLPQVDELIDEESAAQEPVAEGQEDELEFETADVDANDDLNEIEEPADRDTASFGFGDPAD
jgi:hypothetical protein